MRKEVRCGVKSAVSWNGYDSFGQVQIVNCHLFLLTLIQNLINIIFTLGKNYYNQLNQTKLKINFKIELS